MNNNKLKGGKDFFDVENPMFTFKSTKFVKTGPHMFEVDGDSTIRRVSSPEKLVLTTYRNVPCVGDNPTSRKGSPVNSDRCRIN